MMTDKNYGLTGIMAVTMLLVGGCAGQSPPVTFYTLGSDIAEIQSAGTACSNRGIAVGPVSWPRYLDQPRIVTRTGPNTLDFNEFHRWGGSLRDDFKRVLTTSLSSELQTRKIADFRKTLRFTPDYRVELDVSQFDGQLGGEVVLDATWAIVEHETGRVLELRDTVVMQQMSGQDYEALAGASSRAVTELSDKIAAELLKICSVSSQ